MERDLLKELIKWNNGKNRKPLILRGARQVGKTWLAKEFGKRYFANTVYINFDKERVFHDLLSNTLSPQRIITAISAATGERIDAKNTLIIFDEVQEEPRALTALKYFNEESPEYAIIATGSFMGIALHEGTSFPVGKVEQKTLYPLNFCEFLRALGKEELLKLIESKDADIIKSLRAEYIELLREYYAVGGMPEVVSSYVESRDFNEVREKQDTILSLYRQDFSKHAESVLVARLNQVWDVIPAQLAKENRKFIYGQIKEGARAKDFELAIMWLADCGLIHIVRRVSKPNLPLKAYEDFSAFKVYMNDVGLLGAMGGLSPKTIIDGNKIFTEFKGALTEQYVLQQLVSDLNVMPNYYSADNSRAEIDFIVQRENEIIPIEVKAEENLQSKSLKAFINKYGGKGVRISMSDYREQDWLVNYPLYSFMRML